MPKGDHLELEGTITDALGGGKYRIGTGFGGEIIAQLSGKMKSRKIRVLPGDYVKVSVSPYDPSHGFITYRGK
jgi:translation initiation factor IF-1